MNLFERLSGLAVRHLRREQIAALRARYQGGRRRLHPLIRALNGTFDAGQLRAHLEQRVGTTFEILMVHSSVNHMLPMYTGDVMGLLDMLRTYCGPQRTLVMPAFYFGERKYGGTRETFRIHPRFDVRRTPSQMGLLTELFRRSKGVVSSRNPVYRVCATGPLAAELTRGHENAETPSGIGTPFDYMAKHDTLIVGIGKPFQVLTQVHHAEAVLGDDFPVPRGPADPLPMTLVEGPVEVPFILAGRSPQWNLNMWKLPSIMGPDRLKSWRFHQVPMFATRARDVTESLIAAARRGITLYEKS